MNIQIIQVPYDSGYKSVRTGYGPERFLEYGLDKFLRHKGHKVSVQRIVSNAPLATEIGTAFELNRHLSKSVKLARDAGSFPLVLAGNCNSCLGTIAGLGQEQLGVVWFDAHGDFNTPETTLSGFFDGMGLAMAAGYCWKPLLETIPGFRAISEANIVHIGGRDLDWAEEELMRQSELELIPPVDNIHEVVGSVLDRLNKRVGRLYLHIDMDVLDVGEALPNQLAVPGGLFVEEVERVIQMVKGRFEICAAAITSFDPAYDKEDAVLQAGVRIIEAIVT